MQKLRCNENLENPKKMQGTISRQHIEMRSLTMHACVHTHTKATSLVWFDIASKFEMQHNLIIELQQKGLW